ncbi:MAG TPA: hypothetical protein VD908_20395 [Cytophagales bacterium]|nr:hypothetical protein [Cytophagales bacterium]
MKKFLYGSVAVLIVLVAFILLFISYANYSEGTRAGIVVKISKRGYLIKTIEGQLNEGGMAAKDQSVVPTIWNFSVKRNKEEVLKQLEEAQLTGERVKLYYKEKYYRFPWIGDTKYYVYKVEKSNSQGLNLQNE